MKNKTLIIAIVAVLLVGGAGAYYFTKNSKKDDKTTGTTTNQSGEQVADQSDQKYNDACKVFTPEQIGAALGGTYSAGEQDIATTSADGLEGSACAYDQDNDGTTAGMTSALGFSININNYKSSDSAKEFMDSLHSPQTAEGQSALAGEPVDVEGVGDQAFFPRINTSSSISEKTEALYVRVGNQVLVLNATRLAGIDREAVQAGLTSLAKNL